MIYVLGIITGLLIAVIIVLSELFFRKNTQQGIIERAITSLPQGMGRAAGAIITTKSDEQEAFESSFAKDSWEEKSDI